MTKCAGSEAPASTGPFELTGQPAMIAVRAGLEDGAAGVQPAGGPIEDATVLRAAHAPEPATGSRARGPTATLGGERWGAFASDAPKKLFPGRGVRRASQDAPARFGGRRLDPPPPSPPPSASPTLAAIGARGQTDPARRHLHCHKATGC